MNWHARGWVGVVGALLALATWTGTATAQAGALKISARAGVAIPAGDLWQIQDPGASVGGAVEFYFTRVVGIRGEVSADFLNDIVDSFGVVPSPPMRLVHFNGGFAFDFTRPSNQDFPLTFTAAIGAGATSASAKESYEDGSSVDFGRTMFTLNGAAEAGWEVSEMVNIFLAGYAYFMSFDAEETAVFADRSPEVLPFDTGWSFPITLGIKVSVR